MCTLRTVAIKECCEIIVSLYIPALNLKILDSHLGTLYGQRTKPQYRSKHRYLLLRRNDKLFLGITAIWRNYHRLQR